MIKLYLKKLSQVSDVQFFKPVTQHCFTTWFRYFFTERHLVFLQQRFQDLFAVCILQGARPPQWVIHILLGALDKITLLCIC
jgi:hypothetical protein